MAVERALFNPVALVRRRVRTGTAGKVRLDEYAAETVALAATPAPQAGRIGRGYRGGRR